MLPEFSRREFLNLGFGVPGLLTNFSNQSSLEAGKVGFFEPPESQTRIDFHSRSFPYKIQYPSGWSAGSVDLLAVDRRMDYFGTGIPGFLIISPTIILNSQECPQSQYINSDYFKQ